MSHSTTEYAPILSGQPFARGDEIKVHSDEWRPIPERIIGRRYVTEVQMRHGIDFRRPVTVAARSQGQGTP